MFDKFSLFSGLKINNVKSETTGVGVKKKGLRWHSAEWTVSI